MAVGLKLRYSLFYGVQPAEVYDVYARFWAAVGHPLCDPQYDPANPHRHRFEELALHEPGNGWMILSWNAGWEYALRRQAQMVVSATLGCSGLFVFVFDGDFWGYELFRNGVALDHFVQDPAQCNTLFDAYCDCRGKPERIATEFPWLRTEDLAPYLVQLPDMSISDAEYERLDVPARAGDEFTRFAECSVLDFLRLLGIAVKLSNEYPTRYVTLPTPKWRAFELAGWDEFPSRRHPVRPT